MTRPERETETAEAAEAVRLDKWLFFARFFRSRAIAAELIGAGRMRVNGQPVSRPGRLIRPGDVLTFPQGSRIRVIRLIAPGTRRGPAQEAQGLYRDLDENHPVDEGRKPDTRRVDRPVQQD